jgi:hypothetical protein
VGITRILREVSGETLGGVAARSREQATNTYVEAAEMIRTGKPSEEVQLVADAGTQRLEHAIVTERRRTEVDTVFIPGVITALRERYGIEEPPEDFILLTAARYLAETGGEEGYKLAGLIQDYLERKDVSVEIEPEKPEKNIKLRLKDFTDRQEAMATSIFRVPNEEEVPEAMSLEEAIKKTYADQLAAADEQLQQEAYAGILRQLHVAKKEVLSKVSNVVVEVMGEDKGLTVETLGQNLDKFNNFPKLQQILERVVRVEAYREMTMPELINYVYSNQSIRLRKEE